MARNLLAILDDLTASLAELKATLAPLALIGGTIVTEAIKPAGGKRRAKRAPSRARGSISPKRRAAMRDQGRYMGAISQLSAVKRAQVKKVRAEKGVAAAIAAAAKLQK